LKHIFILQSGTCGRASSICEDMQVEMASVHGHCEW